MSHWASLIDPACAIPAASRGRVHLLSDDEPGNPAPLPEPKKAKSPQRYTRKKSARQSMEEHMSRRWERSLKRRLLELVAAGPMAQRDFRAGANRVKREMKLKGDNSIPHAVGALLDAGLLVCEVRITPAGLHKLGIKE